MGPGRPQLPNRDDRHRMAADDHVMRVRLAPRLPGAAEAITANLPSLPVTPPPPWKIVIPAADGAELLVLREEDGRLVAEGEESRWSEAARRFVGVMLQWAGQSSINWKDEARKAVEGQ